MRIGGEFELGAEQFCRQAAGLDPFAWVSNPHLLVDTGRSALLIALQDILKKGGKREAWIPQFCCESVTLPFKQLGFRLNFYSMGEDLQSPSGLPHSFSGETFLFINYFGIRNEAIISWLNQRRQQGAVFVVEDNVQAGFSQHVGNVGDYVVYSYRKLLPQPDGAVLCYKELAIDPALAEPDETFVSEKVLGKIIRGMNGEANLFLDLLNSSERRIDAAVVPRSISRFSSYLMERTNVHEVSEKRRQNWMYLKKRMDEVELQAKGISPLFTELKQHEVPLGFPIVSKHRDQLRSFLMKHNIFCPIHWVLSENAGETHQHPTDLKLSQTILTLPIDQRLTQQGLDFLLDKLLLFTKEVYKHA